MRMKKCDPRAFARCQYRKQCSDSPEHTSFYEGTECDYFNQQVINKPMTNADSIRAMSDEELAKLFYSVYKRSCIDFVNQSGIKAEIKFKNSEGSEAAFLKYLQSPAEENT